MRKRIEKMSENEIWSDFSGRSKIHLTKTPIWSRAISHIFPSLVASVVSLVPLRNSERIMNIFAVDPEIVLKISHYD